MGQDQLPIARERLLNKSELAQRLRLSMRSIDRGIVEGTIPKGFRLGGAVRWRESLVDKWIEAGCPPVTASGPAAIEKTGPKVKGGAQG
jgi:predicted DNA-binding transcriptional regulator AlpA